MGGPENEAQPVSTLLRKRSSVNWVVYGYFTVILALIVTGIVHEYRLVRLDARVHRVMNSASPVTIHLVKEGLSDVLKNETEFPAMENYLHFGAPDQRQLFITYDPTSGTVTAWYMMQGSDPIDTARAVDGRATQWLLKFYGVVFLIVFSPLPFFWWQPRVSSKPLKIFLRIAYVILMVPSVGVALLTGIVIAAIWVGI